MIGETIGGRYEIVRALGEGGMGAVYEARQLATGRRVALKMIHPEKLRTPHLVARFEVEARAAGGIDSEHVVQVLDVDVDDERKFPFLAMEYLVGEDLDAVLDRHGKLPQDLAVKIAVQVCRGLEKAHARGILHRDIKPANLILAEREAGELRVKIVDFGLAKVFAESADEPKGASLTITGMLLGSPQYMSPEQARASGKLDERTDVWSLGMVLYELLTGRTAFAGLAPLTKVIEAVTTQPVPPVRALEESIDVGVAAAVEKALSIDSARRYASISELRRVLEAHLGGDVALHRSMFETLPKPGRFKERASPANDKATVAQRPAPAPAPAGAALALPTKVSGSPMTKPPPDSEEDRNFNIVIPVEPETRPLARMQTVREGAGTLVSGIEPAPTTTSDIAPSTEREPPRTEAFAGVPVIPAPPAPAPRERPRLLPFVVLATVGAGLAVGAVFLYGRANAEDGAVATSEIDLPTSKPLTTETKPAMAPPPSAAPSAAGEGPLAGLWKSESGRLFEGVSTPEGFALRFKDAKGFEEQGYATGDVKFTLQPRAGSPGMFDVVDYARPLPPAGTSYDPSALSSCVVPYASVGNRHLSAELQGDTLTVEQAVLSAGSTAFELSGTKVMRCKMDRVTPALRTSKLTRQR